MEGRVFDRPLLQPCGAVPASVMINSRPDNSDGWPNATRAAGRVRWPRGEDESSDPVVDALNGILQLAAARPEMSCAMFTDSVRDAITAHLRNKRGGGISAERRSGLTGWQERRAKQYLTAHVGDDAPIAEAAEACKLSYSYFIRAFKTTTGQTPHRWLNGYRIELAKELLLGPQSIADIAQICGFADQSHLTRVFVRLAGTPPGSWRRQYRDLAADTPAPDLRERDAA
jgi:AraC family transcriptional regulator